MGGKCQDCGWSEHLPGLEFHHPNSNKDFNIAQATLYTKAQMEAEVKKCRLLCSTCHRKAHAPTHFMVLAYAKAEGLL